MKKLSVTFDESKFALLELTDGDSTRSKNVDAEAVCQKLASMTNSVITDVPGMSGCRRIITGPKGKLNAYIFMYPAQRRDTTMLLSRNNMHIDEKAVIRRGIDNSGNSTVTLSVMYPDTVIIVTATENIEDDGTSKYCLSDIFVYGAKIDNDNIDNTRLYKWPYTNVFDDARACTGRINKFFTLRQLGTAPMIVLDGICNTDLQLRFSRDPLGVESSYGLFKYFGEHKEANTFPDDYLTASVGTLSQVQKAFIQG